MKEINLVVSGGGVKLYYFVGIYSLLQELENNNIIKIKSYSAISSGSVFIILMVCKIGIPLILKKYKKYICLFQQRSKLKITKFKLLENFLNEILPNNAHTLCSNKVYITTTQLEIPFKKITFNSFKSKKDLIKKILASGSFPFLVNEDIYYQYNNKNYIDGCFTINTPIIFKENTLIFRPFLTGRINLFSLEKLSDSNTFYKGYNDMKKVLNGSNNILAISWYKNENYFEKLKKYILYICFLIKNEYF